VTTKVVNRWHGNRKDGVAIEKRENAVTIHFETRNSSIQTYIRRLIYCDTENTATCARFEVLSAVLPRIEVFWYVAACHW
jgi:hypothetical protein